MNETFEYGVLEAIKMYMNSEWRKLIMENMENIIISEWRDKNYEADRQDEKGAWDSQGIAIFCDIGNRKVLNKNDFF